MIARAVAKSHAKDFSEPQRAAELLGGVKTLGARIATPMAAHDVLLKGLPGTALTHLLGGLTVLQGGAALEKAVGMSLRTFQRRKDAPTTPLSQDQSARAWKFAEILARATHVFGDQRAAETWLDKPAMGLDNRRPIDLLATPAGSRLVENFLQQLEYGVYV